MTTTTKPRRATLTLRSREATPADKPGADPETHRGPEGATDATPPEEAAASAPKAEDGLDKAKKTPASFAIYGKLWMRAMAACSRGEDGPNAATETRRWLSAIVVGAIRNRERTRDQEHEYVSIRAPVGTGDRYAAAAERAGYESVSEWACTVLDAAAEQRQREATE